MTQQTNDNCEKIACISNAITEIDSQIRLKSVRLRQLKEYTKNPIAPLADHGPLSINAKLRPIPPPTPVVIHGVTKRLRNHHRRSSAFRNAYESKIKDIKEKENAERKELQASLSTQERLLREHRELTLVGDIHGISAASASKHNIERQLRMLRRGGTVQAPGNNASTVAHSLGRRRSSNKLSHRRADVCVYVPTQFGVRLDGMSRRMEDPLKEYYDARVINPWTMSERMLFLKLFVWIGKDFVKIAQYFMFKTAQDVVRFYYEHKLTFRLKEMRERHLEGQVITDDDIITLSRIGTVAANMSWNFEKEECSDQGHVGTVGSATVGVGKSVEHRKGNENRQAKSLGFFKNNNDQQSTVLNEDEENLSFLSNAIDHHKLTR